MGGRHAGKAAPFGLRGLAAASADVSGSAREAADARGPCIVRERPRTGGSGQRAIAFVWMAGLV